MEPRWREAPHCQHPRPGPTAGLLHLGPQAKSPSHGSHSGQQGREGRVAEAWEVPLGEPCVHGAEQSGAMGGRLRGSHKPEKQCRLFPPQYLPGEGMKIQLPGAPRSGAGTPSRHLRGGIPGWKRRGRNPRLSSSKAGIVSPLGWPLPFRAPGGAGFKTALPTAGPAPRTAQGIFRVSGLRVIQPENATGASNGHVFKKQRSTEQRPP